VFFVDSEKNQTLTNPFLRDSDIDTPKALHTLAWGQPRSGATTGNQYPIYNYPERVAQIP
jgi:hypothetical protein